MSDILHRRTINAPHEQVHDLVATKTGLERWWVVRRGPSLLNLSKRVSFVTSAISLRICLQTGIRSTS